jgi:hypothetical protein
MSSACSDSPQQPDPDFIPKNTKNSFSGLTNPVIFIDEAHHNFHTIRGRYNAFAQVLRSDGYTVQPGTKKFTRDYLKQADILVIANALDSNRRDYNPPYGDAFTAEEVASLKEWVSQGGSLLFIADHAPFPIVSSKLALAFGFEFNNGSVNNATFHLDNNTLAQHAITKGNSHSEEVVKVESFGGSAFKVPYNAESLLTLGNGASSLMSDIPMKATTGSYRVSMDGWSQGAVLKVGKGRVAIFAEAMMFTSQVYTPTGRKMGLVSYGAEQNEQFLLNVMHWLSGLI